MALERLFDRYDKLVILDTETTGIDHKNDEIIELAALCLQRRDGAAAVTGEMDVFLRLSPGRRLPPEITRLTGITPEMLETQGISKEEAARRFLELLSGPRTLAVAYNAQFDLCFLFYFLHRLGLSHRLKGIEMLDALSVYKDRRDYPHKLANAIEAYGLSGRNTHRAIDDTAATAELLAAMEAERNDLDRYINLFGYNPRFGVSGPRIGSVTYVPQPYRRKGPLYENLP